MIAFIDDYRAAYEVEPICKVLQIAPSTYHGHAAQRADPAKHSPRAKRDLALMADVQRVFDANFGVYGVRKVWRQLGREGKDVARCTVARLMRRRGLRGGVRGREDGEGQKLEPTHCRRDRRWPLLIRTVAGVTHVIVHPAFFDSEIAASCSPGFTRRGSFGHMIMFS